MTHLGHTGGCCIGRDGVTEYQKQSIVAAQNNLAFVARSGALLQSRDPSIWDEAILSDPRVTDLVPGAEMYVDEEIEAAGKAAERTPGEG